MPTLIDDLANVLALVQRTHVGPPAVKSEIERVLTRYASEYTISPACLVCYDDGYIRGEDGDHPCPYCAERRLRFVISPATRERVRQVAEARVEGVPF